jgi:hypothetical protein
MADLQPHDFHLQHLHFLHGLRLCLGRRRLYSNAKTGDERGTICVHLGLLLRESGTINSSCHGPIETGIAIEVLRRHLTDLIILLLLGKTGVMLSSRRNARKIETSAWTSGVGARNGSDATCAEARQKGCTGVGGLGSGHFCYGKVSVGNGGWRWRA